MGYWAKTVSVAAFLASFSLAQTYDLPIVFIDTKGECLDQNVTEKIPVSRFVGSLRPSSRNRVTASKSATRRARAWT